MRAKKFFDVAANLGEDDSGKIFSNARYRIKLGVKIIYEARFKLFEVLKDDERETRRGKHDTERIFGSILNLVSFVESEFSARRLA